MRRAAASAVGMGLGWFMFSAFLLFVAAALGAPLSDRVIFIALAAITAVAIFVSILDSIGSWSKTLLDRISHLHDLIWNHDRYVSHHITQRLRKSIRDPQWIRSSHFERSRLILNRDGYRCVNCHATCEDDVLIVVPIVTGSRASRRISNFATICYACDYRLIRTIFDDAEIQDYPADWDMIRRSVYRRDSYTCRNCMATEAELHAHHVVPLSKGGSNSTSNIVTLCRDCHTSIHQHMSDDVSNSLEQRPERP